MKKIYMILAAFSLLTLSLNAQMLPSVDRSQLYVAQTDAVSSFYNMTKSMKALSSILPEVNPNGSASARGQFRAPLKINSDETTVGPFTGDNFNATNGIGFGAAYANPQMIAIETDLLRSEYEDFIGEDIIGFRLALAGDATQTVQVGEFIAWPMNSQGAWNQNYQYTWSIGELTTDVGEPYTQYERVTSTSDLESGAEYLIVCEGSAVAFNGGLATLDAGNNVINITNYMNNGIIQSNATTDAATFTITANGNYYTIRSKSGHYIGRTSSNNGFNESATQVYNNSITFTGNNAVIRGRSSTNAYASDTYYLRFNSATGTSNYRFRYYGANSQQPIQLYKKVTVTPTAPAYVGLQAGQWHEFYLDEPVTFNVGDDNAGLSLGYTYIQYPTGTTGQNLFPIAINPESTTHNHYAYLSTTTGGSGDIIITVPSYDTMFQTITVTDNNTGTTLTSWSSSEATVTDGTYTYYNMPTGWTLSNVYMFTYTTSGYTFGYLSSDSQSSITIASSLLNGSTNVSVSITGAAFEDGQYVDVNGDSRSLTSGYTFSQTWNPVELTAGTTSTGWNAFDFSSYGDLAVQLIFKSKKTAAPVITGQVDPNNESNYVITATGDGTVTLTVGDQTVTGNGSASITIPRTDVDQTVTATATAQASGKEVSDPTTQTFVVPLIQTAAPVITGQVVGDNYVITATGDGTVTLNVGDQTASGQGSASITIPLTSVVQNVTATATAQETGKAVSETTTQNFTIPFLQTATPVITYTTVGESVVITATGNGSVTLTVGDETSTAMGSVSITVPFGVEATTVTATATAWENGKAESEPATQQVPIPAGEGWLIMDGTYNNPNDLLSFKYGDEDIMMIDQFLASTFNNDHPAGYTYTLRQTIDGVQQSSSPVSIPVYKTSSTLQGLYTQSQVDGDTKLQYRANVMNTEIDYDVHPDHNTLYYNLYRSDINADYPELSVQKRRSQLQRFEEKIGENAYQYFLFETHQSGIAPKYDRIGSQIAERLDTAYIEGVAGDEIAYVPVITTVGLYSARADGLNNTYGSDIKRNWLGSVNIDFIQGTLSTNSVNGANYGIWKAPNGVDYCVYTPFMRVSGIQPPDWVAHDDDHYTFEPYMYRVWCIYPDARDFAHNANGQLIDAGELGDTILLQTVYVQDPTVNSVYFGKEQWVPADGKLPYTFGVPASVASDPSVLQFIVRFYYKRVLVADEPQEPGRFNANREGDDEQYYIVENEGDGQDITTGIAEFYSGKAIIGVSYVNPQGMTSDKPFDGVNIVITRYNDGTTSTFKQVVR